MPVPASIPASAAAAAATTESRSTSAPKPHAAARIQVIDRAAALLDTIARYPEPVSLKILGAETGLHASTAHRILASLIQNGLVERDAAGHYRLGLRLLQLGVRLRGDVDLRAIARPVMEALRDQLGESVNLTIREGDEVVYIEKATPNRMIHVQQLIGARAPLHVTAVGKLMLGAGGAEAINAYAERTNLPAYTRNTLTDVAALREVCLHGIRDGYALDDEEAELDVGCIGVLLYDGTDRVAGGLSVSAPIERRQLAWIEDLRRAGQRISEQLG
ncbi:IclR family transcriptional regulator [Lamprobacter modestohalophilus]|uniref:IclR family transcriptional regulator n=1 Tax=Lamprobacter modestohalophilus TaxID=1064514 RepID=UPI002ADEC929|nr:IclR family transcriptional regulator [Lamprobacter modestohalophilus]MEA1050232.1 IclR family transcriptional regulator [Lamprobacter modestohalophilus]